MNYLVHYFNELKVRQGFTQDKEAAEFLGMRPQDFNRAKKTGFFPDEKCFELAAAINENPARIIAARELVKAKNAEQRDKWKQLFDAVATVAAVGLAYVILVTLPGIDVLESTGLALLLTANKDYRKYVRAFLYMAFQPLVHSLFPVMPSTGTAAS